MTWSSPLLLALDTSTAMASVALYDGQRVLSETTWFAGREHSTRLLVEVELSLERSGKSTADLTGLVVARGPGSFTGVRVALSIAKGIAAGRGLPLWGVSSLDVLATAAGPTDLPVRVVVEAGRGRFATGLYVEGASTDEPRLMSSADLAASLTRPTIVIGELTPQARQLLQDHPDARLASVAAGLRRGGLLAELGWQRAASGDPGLAHAVDALYVG